MAKDRYSPTERIGVNAVEAIAIKELDWIFREQPIEDMGIDAHLEAVDGKNPTGKLIALQIKTGKGNFTETKTGYVYYGKKAHLDYWTGHSLPVLLVGHLPETGETLWVQVTKDSVTPTKKGWKIELSKKAAFDKSARRPLDKIMEGSPEDQKLRKLALHEPIMRHIKAGKKVTVSMEDWINKSLSRSDIVIRVYDKSGKAKVVMQWRQMWAGYSVGRIAQLMFPWAEIDIDAEFYEQHEEEREEEEHDFPSLAGHPDDDLPSTPQPPPRKGRPRTLDERIYPYEREIAGEIDAYRLELTLNKLGKAYLVVAGYLTEK